MLLEGLHPINNILPKGLYLMDQCPNVTALEKRDEILFTLLK
jgi:hypothetical protein